MSEVFTLDEAAAIAEVKLDTFRTALEKRAVPPSRKEKRGKVVRYHFSVGDGSPWSRSIVRGVFPEWLVRRSPPTSRWSRHPRCRRQRVAALEQLGRDTVEAVIWPLNEVQALVLDRSLHWSERESALEEDWLLGCPIFCRRVCRLSARFSRTQL